MKLQVNKTLPVQPNTETKATGRCVLQEAQTAEQLCGGVAAEPILTGRCVLQEAQTAEQLCGGMAAEPILTGQMLALLAQLQTELPRKRFWHSVSVAQLACALAMAAGVSPLTPVMTAGLLHDCAKYVPDEELLVRCEAHGIPVSEAEAAAPFLLHAKYGAYRAEYEFGIKDSQILSAIRFHTTGKPAMSCLELLIFLADYIAVDRTQPTVPTLSEIRRLAFTDLEGAASLALENTLRYLRECGQKIDPLSEEAYDYYLHRGERNTSGEQKGKG